MIKYTYIAEQIRNQILVTKELKPNQMLKTEVELGKEYGVSKMTIKKALDSLVTEGLIYKKRGLGTFVKNLSHMPLSNIMNSQQDPSLTGFSRTHKGENISTRVVLYTVIPAGESIAAKLNISAEDFVYHMIRVRCIDEQPIVLEETYMPLDIIPGLKRIHAENSIYSYIENDLQYSIQSSHILIKAKICSTELAEHLQLNPQEPVAEVTQIAFLDNGQIFEYSISSHRYDYYEFHAVVVRK